MKIIKTAVIQLIIIFCTLNSFAQKEQVIKIQTQQQQLNSISLLHKISK